MTGFPEWMIPMAATLTQERFTGPEWIFERKFDGIRLLAFKRGDEVRLLSRNKLPQHLPAIAAAIRDGPDLVFAGKVGTGLDTALLLDLRARLDRLTVPAPPFTRGHGLPRGAHWVRPEIAVEVAFIEWTAHGKLRHPRLLGVRG